MKRLFAGLVLAGAVAALTQAAVAQTQPAPSGSPSPSPTPMSTMRP